MSSLPWMDSWPSHDDVGGFVVDFEAVRTEYAPHRLERKVDVVIRSMQKRRSAHKVVARSYAAELCHMRSKDCAPSPSSVSRMSEEEFEAFEAAVCAICPPQGRFGSALRTKESASDDEEWPRPVGDVSGD